MSYILEALRKAEKQREVGQVPGIGSVHEATTRGRGPRWTWMLAVILFLNTVIIGALYWSAEDAKVPAVTTAAAPPDPDVRQPDGSPRDMPENAVEPVPAPEVDKAPPRDGARRQQPSLAKTGDGARPLKPLPLPKVPHKDPQQVRPDKPAAVLSTSPPSQPAPMSEPEQLPVWPLVADDLFHQINSELKVNVHVYSKNREKRFVLLNMKTYHEGDRLFEGPQLEEITQDGVVLSFRGERFRVPAR